jgi:hypothetical protein
MTDVTRYIVLALNVAWGQLVLQTWMVTGSGQCLAAFLISSAAVLMAVNGLTLDEYRRRTRNR